MKKKFGNKGIIPRRGYNNLNPSAWYNVFYTKPSYEISTKKGSSKLIKKRKKDNELPF